MIKKKKNNLRLEFIKRDWNLEVIKWNLLFIEFNKILEVLKFWYIIGFFVLWRNWRFVVVLWVIFIFVDYGSDVEYFVNLDLKKIILI